VEEDVAVYGDGAEFYDEDPEVVEPEAFALVVY
jgi:hypothetical protein